MECFEGEACELADLCSFAAVNNTMIGNLGPTEEEYDALLAYSDIKLIADISIWNNYNEFTIGAVPGSKGRHMKRVRRSFF